MLDLGSIHIRYYNGLQGHTINFLFFEFLCFWYKSRAYEDTLLSFYVLKTNCKAKNDIGKFGIWTYDHFLSVLELEKCVFQLSYMCHHVPAVLLLSKGSQQTLLLGGKGLNFTKLCWKQELCFKFGKISKSVKYCKILYRKLNPGKTN